MIFNWNAFTKKFWVIATVIVVIVVVFLNWFYHSQLSQARKAEIGQYESYLNDTIQGLVKQKQVTTEVVAIALSSSIDFRQILKNPPPDLHERLKNFTDELAKYTDYKSLWVQLIDLKGNSIGRSWTAASGDNLLLVRKDLAEVLKRPRKVNDFSVGKFALTFKSIAPIYDKNGKLLGLLDVISQVNSIDESLKQSSSVHSVVLVDKKYRSQLTQAYNKKFIDDYYVANQGARPQDLKLIAKFGVHHFFENHQHKIIDGTLVIATPLKNIFGETIGLWLSLKPINDEDFVNTNNLYKNYVLLMGSTLLFLLMVLFLVYFKKKSDLERSFFYQVFDESSEIIYVTDRHQVVQANRQFFALFDGVETVDEFNKNFSCLSNLLIEEEGYLARYVDGVLWYEYLLHEEHKTLLAKLKTREGVKVFKVKANVIKNQFGLDYISVLMTDITEEMRYKEELEHLIIHDELTGIYNRHYFNDALDEEIKRAHRYGTPFSIIAYDIDYFKQVNDDFGHDIGDKVLTSLCQLVVTTLRDTDRLCRVGGEEFCILMPETDLEAATLIAERLRKTISESSNKDVPRTITISLGVTRLNRWDNAMSLYKRADVALYQAKANGRNRVEVFAD